ncbi:MAG: ATP-binding protein [Clostridia bacterium]|nr:ATP-binding protein [Clostridia bacterium]MBP3560799.1 ATP-binding protein [Clostridia bacterium]
MKFSDIIYSKAENILKSRREQAEKLADMRRKEFIAKYPELIDIENTMKNAALDVIRSVGADGKRVNIYEVAKINLQAQEKRKELIKKAGYPEDYLEPPYTCKKCKDSGIVNGKLCECHLAVLQQLSVSELSCSPLLARSTFDSFDLKYYSDIKDRELGFSPRDIMRGCYEMLKAYAENFTCNSNSFFFTGATGLGKTHLALAVLNKVTQNGFSVYYSSAGSIVKKLEKERFGRADESVEDEIERSDLLIIDDLGAEFSTAFSQAAINELVNNAILSGKPMIIISNLSRAELEEKYGQRLTSRLNCFEIIQFVGEDIRQQLA